MPHDDKIGRDIDALVRSLIVAGDRTRATTEAVRAFAPEVLGFLSGVLGSDADADEIFGAVSERLWRSLATFEWRCSLRTWVYVLTRREIQRFRRGARRHVAGRVRISELQEVIAATRLSTPSGKRNKLALLRDELPLEDREILVLRIDRELSWDEIALAFVDDPEHCAEDERKRVVARLRKRFQLVKDRLAARAREEGLWPE